MPAIAHAAVHQADVDSALQRQDSRVFEAVPAQVSQARRFLAAILGDRAAAADAIMCVSELAANACLHSASRRAGGTFVVRVLMLDGGQVRIEVADEGGPWVTRVHRDGRPHGLAIVASLACDSGIRGDARGGRISWATFSCQDHASRATQEDRRQVRADR
jgi:two-component sensor histidine kinase